MNQPREVIKKVITSSKDDNNEIVYELGMQKNFFFDFNIENIGHNRRDHESIIQYIKRVFSCKVHYETLDYSIAEFCPIYMKETNAKLSVCDKTFYFSYATGIRQRNFMKKREMLTEP